MTSKFDRFDDRAKRTLALAQDEAMRFGHTWLGTEHLMLALLRCGGPANDALVSLGVDLTAARAGVLLSCPRSAQLPTEVTLTPRMKSIIGWANGMTAERNAPVTPPTLLLALVADPDGVGTQVLAQLGATPEKIRQALESGA